MINNKSSFLLNIIFINSLILSCNASELTHEKDGLRHRKYLVIPDDRVTSNTSYVPLEKNDFEKVYQSKAIAKYAHYCIAKKQSFNIGPILEELRKVSYKPWDYELNAKGYKTFIKQKFSIPDVFINDLYNDLVAQIKKEIATKDETESENSEE